MRKLISVVLVILLVTALTGCAVVESMQQGKKVNVQLD